VNYQNGQFAPDDDPGGKPIPDHLATWWDGLQDEHRATFRGPRWAGPNINHRLKVSLAVAKAMHDGLSVDDAVALCLFPDGLGSWPFHAALVRDLWKERAAELVEHEARKATAPLECINFDWWLERELERPVPVLGEVICASTRMLIGGPTGVGKSHLALALAGAIASGR
jgi:hypothetical protein